MQRAMDAPVKSALRNSAPARYCRRDPHGGPHVLPDRPESNDPEPGETRTGQILQFRRRWRAPARRVTVKLPDAGAAGPVDDLAQYEVADRNVDYRGRLLMNVIAIVIVVMLMGVGVWIAATIGAMEKSQDCAMQGRQNCAPIAVH